MAVNVHDYLEGLTYADRYDVSNDLLCSWYSPILLREETSVLHLTPLDIVNYTSSIIQIPFRIQVTNSEGKIAIKNLRVTPQGDSKERIIKIETLLAETPFDISCLVTLHLVSKKLVISNKRIEGSSDPEVSGTLLSYASENPVLNFNLIVTMRQNQGRHEMYLKTYECKTSEKGLFKVKIPGDDFMWKQEPFWIAFNKKISEEIAIDFDIDGQHRSERVAILAALFFDDFHPSNERQFIADGTVQKSFTDELQNIRESLRSIMANAQQDSIV